MFENFEKEKEATLFQLHEEYIKQRKSPQKNQKMQEMMMLLL